MRDVGNQWAALEERKAAFEAGQGQETPEMAAARSASRRPNKAFGICMARSRRPMVAAADAVLVQRRTQAEPETRASSAQLAAEAGSRGLRRCSRSLSQIPSRSRERR